MNGSSPNTDAKAQRNTRVQEVRRLLAVDGTLTPKGLMAMQGFEDATYWMAWSYLREAKAVQS